jgi:rubrerythrin
MQSIFEYAMEMEKDEEELYREMAASVSQPGLKLILSSLADAEVRHYHVLKQLRDKKRAELSEDTLPLEVKNIFRRILDEGLDVDPDTKHTDLYRQAMDVESKVRDFYLSKAEEVDDPAAREILLLISGEEKRHVQILKSIVEYLSRAEPGNWLENAEWYHF